MLGMIRKIILLVDVDRDCEKMVREAAACSGRDTVTARSTRKAFKIIRDEILRLDGVIVDVEPGAHGLALLEAISGCADKPPIIVITALEETYMKPIADEHGALTCFGKPVSKQKLAVALEDVSSRSRMCDRWGSLVPSPPHGQVNDVRRHFRGIATKLSPPISKPARE